MSTCSGDQIRAARALLDWPQARLSQKSGVGLRSIQKMEKGNVDGVHPLMLKAVAETLATAGIVFVEGGVIRRDEPAAA
jgi:predicted transcriptional regulator